MNCSVPLKTIKDVQDVIKCLLAINLNARPDLKEVLNYPLFKDENTASSGDNILKYEVKPEEIEEMSATYSSNPLLCMKELLEKKKMNLKDDFADKELIL